VQELAQAVARDEGGVDPASRVSLRRGTREAWRKSRVGAAWDKPRLGQSAPAGSWPRQELAQAVARDEGGVDPASRVSLRRGTRAAWRKLESGCWSGLTNVKLLEVNLLSFVRLLASLAFLSTCNWTRPDYLVNHWFGFFVVSFTTQIQIFAE